MEKNNVIRVLLVEDNATFAKLVQLYLSKSGEGEFDVIWKTEGSEALDEIQKNDDIDVILMDYFLPGMNGLEITRTLNEKNIEVPIIFLTVSKDVDLAVEVMKSGVEEYIVKEEITTPILPKTLIAVAEKRRLEKEVAELEIRKKRLEAIQEMVVAIVAEIGGPLAVMKELADKMMKDTKDEKLTKYLGIINENVERIAGKTEKLKNLREDKTIQYIKDIRMIDLSE